MASDVLSTRITGPGADLRKLRVASGNERGVEVAAVLHEVRSMLE